MTPREGQTWVHKIYGREFVVVKVNGGHVLLENKDDRPKMRLGMHAAQLQHHYDYVEG